MGVSAMRGERSRRGRARFDANDDGDAMGREKEIWRERTAARARATRGSRATGDARSARAVDTIFRSFLDVLAASEGRVLN